MNDTLIHHGDEALVKSIVSPDATPVDILGRQEIVSRIQALMGTLSDARSSCTFALNGRWGSGKTFVLDMLERSLRRERDGNRFLVFHYNCWQYDYYEEPLIAIVSAMLDSVDEETHLLSSDIRKAAQDCLQTVRGLIFQVAPAILLPLLMNKLGISDDSGELELSIGEGEDLHGYDPYLGLRKALTQSREELSRLAQDRTLVVIVDELDRCLPTYAIKVLERLHHLFAGVENIQVLLAVDRAQLENTVQQIFGEKTAAADYLEKFIDFGLELDAGTVNDNFWEKYADYANLFDVEASAPWSRINEYIAALFSDMEVRRQEALIKKARMVHQLLFAQDEKKDISFLCFELLLVVLSEIEGGLDDPPFRYTDVGYGRIEFSVNRNVPRVLATLMRNLRPADLSAADDGNPSVFMLLGIYSVGVFTKNPTSFYCPDEAKYDGYIGDFKKVKQMLESFSAYRSRSK